MGDEVRAKAENELVTFVTEYCTLIGAQLEAVRATMGETTDAIMTGVSAISDAKDDKRKMADAVLLKRSDEPGTEGEKFQGDDSTFKNAQMDKSVALTDSESGSAKKLTEEIKNFDKLDDQIQDILFGIIGALSTDDVVGQRIEHICTALVDLRDGLASILKSEPNLICEKSVVELENRLLLKMSKDYTMPSEHESFKEVFGNLDVSKLKVS